MAKPTTMPTTMPICMRNQYTGESGWRCGLGKNRAMRAIHPNSPASKESDRRLLVLRGLRSGWTPSWSAHRRIATDGDGARRNRLRG